MKDTAEREADRIFKILTISSLFSMTSAWIMIALF